MKFFLRDADIFIQPCSLGWSPGLTPHPRSSCLTWHWHWPKPGGLLLKIWSRRDHDVLFVFNNDRQTGEKVEVTIYEVSPPGLKRVAVYMDVFRELWWPPCLDFSLSQLCLCALSGPMSPEVYCWEIILGASRATGKRLGVRRSVSSAGGKERGGTPIYHSDIQAAADPCQI